MSHSRSWDETKPAGTSLISSGDDTIREISVDIRQRMEIDHLWNTSLDHDGKHWRVLFRTPDNVTNIVDEIVPQTTAASN